MAMMKLSLAGVLVKPLPISGASSAPRDQLLPPATATPLVPQANKFRGTAGTDCRYHVSRGRATVPAGRGC